MLSAGKHVELLHGGLLCGSHAADLRWTSSSEGRLLRERFQVRLLRCASRPGSIAGKPKTGLKLLAVVVVVVVLLVLIVSNAPAKEKGASEDVRLRLRSVAAMVVRVWGVWQRATRDDQWDGASG